MPKLSPGMQEDCSFLPRERERRNSDTESDVASESCVFDEDSFSFTKKLMNVPRTSLPRNSMGSLSPGKVDKLRV